MKEKEIFFLRGTGTMEPLIFIHTMGLGYL